MDNRAEEAWVRFSKQTYRSEETPTPTLEAIKVGFLAGYLFRLNEEADERTHDLGGEG